VHLLASRINWGSVPDWIAGVGSALAFAGFAIAFIWEVRKRRQDDGHAAEDRRDALKRHARLVVVTPPMCDVVIAAAQSLTVEDLKLVDEEDLSSPTGLLVLPYPLLVKSVGGDLGDDRAFCWHTPARFTLPDPTNRDAVVVKPAVRVSVYHDTHGPVRPDSFLDFAAEARREGTPLPPLLLDAVRCLPFRAIEADAGAGARLAQAAKAVDGARRGAAMAVGRDESRVVGEYTSGNQIEDVDDTFTLRFLYAFWRLCEQRIAEVEHLQTNHAARVIAERTGLSPEVRLIRLRQRVEQRGGKPTGRNWQHRWVVRMLIRTDLEAA